MLKFISFGSGSSGNCYCLLTENEGIFIDMGIGPRSLKKYCREYGVSISSMRHILITHDHADHIKSVGSISNDFSIPVYATAEVHEGIRRNYCVAKKIPDQMVMEIRKGESFSIGEFNVTSFGVPHDSSDNVGYSIECRGIVFCVITDAGSITDEMCRHISDAEYLVIEANHDEEMLNVGPYPSHLKKRILSSKGHLSNINCGNVLAKNMTEKLKHVWLCHLSEENNHPELARKTVESVLGSHGVIIGKDIELEVLRRKLPSGPFELIK